MKKMMTMVATVMMMATATASNNGIEEGVKKPSAVAPFSVVNVNVPARVRLIQGEEYGVMVSTSAMYDDAMLDCSVKDGVLYISTENQEVLSALGRGAMITVITPADDTSIRLGDNVRMLRRK